jgi:alkyl hydroperoxide reductase subunit AhpF
MVRALSATRNQESSAVPSVEGTVTSENVFDVIVMGAGPAGEIAAARAVRAGLTTAVVQRCWAGGECGYCALGGMIEQGNGGIVNVSSGIADARYCGLAIKAGRG